jgi:nucleotide-binding universal stress UspA family protein
MRIVVGIDGSEVSQTALELVTTISWPRGTAIRLVAAYQLAEQLAVARPRPGASRDDPVEPNLDAEVHAQTELLGQRGYRVERVISRGRPADVLLSEAAELTADLIIVGSRGRGVAASALLGSVSATLVDHAECPVLVARVPEVSRILLATDGSRSAEAIPSVLAAWGVFRNAPIDVLSVAAPETGEATRLTPEMRGTGPRPMDASHEVSRHRVMADEMAARLVTSGWRADGTVRYGDAAREIELAARERGADLIITGSRGLSGLQRLLLGSVAHHVVLHSRCSVLVMGGHVPARLSGTVLAFAAT